MKLLRASSRGITIIEALIVISIVATLGTLGLFVGVNQYRSYALGADLDLVVSQLQTARARAMNNINFSDHGVYFGTAEYVLFQGSSYESRNQTYDEASSRAGIISVTGPTEVVFNRLRGDISGGGGSINLSNNASERIINLNNEGRISW